jgi:hypothetical protein
MRIRLAAASACVALVLASCSHLDNLPNVKGPEKPTVDTKVSPLTGLKQDGPPHNPVFMVKIENTEGGVPQYGLNHADIVIEEFVEFDVTRLAAFFYSDLPTKVGHVRSARTTDVGLAKPVHATVVASGGDHTPIDRVEDAHLPLYTYDRNDPGWSSDHNKVAPYHVLWDLTKLNTHVKARVPHRSYFAFGNGPSAADATKKTTSVRVEFAPGRTTQFAYTDGRWARSPDRAASGESFRAENLVVIFASITDAGYHAQGGAPVPETVMEGTGRAVIFSGGSATEATWSKQHLNSSMTFRSKKTGKSIGLKPGRVWLEAAPRGGSVKY